MIEKGIIKVGDVIFVYSQPPEKAMVAVVQSIDYPIIHVDPIKRAEAKKKPKETDLDISKPIPLSLWSEDQARQFLTPAEVTRIKKAKPQPKAFDMFA